MNTGKEPSKAEKKLYSPEIDDWHMGLSCSYASQSMLWWEGAKDDSVPPG